MNDRICGTCSLCGGAVTCPSIWFGVIPPIPTCSSCGATAVQSFGPIIPMQPKRPQKIVTIFYGYRPTSTATSTATGAPTEWWNGQSNVIC